MCIEQEKLPKRRPSTGAFNRFVGDTAWTAGIASHAVDPPLLTDTQAGDYLRRAAADNLRSITFHTSSMM